MKNKHFFLLSRCTHFQSILLICVFIITSVDVFAQTTTVTGVVTDTSNETLPGVSVYNRTSLSGSITDIDGNYSIKASVGDIIEYSYVGMETQSHKVKSNVDIINVVLEQDSELLQDIVVIGYGSAKKADLTGAISNVKAEEIMKQPSMNAIQSVQGKLAGVNIVSTGTPGANPTMTIRGMGTALGGRDPLYIVDGFPVDNISTISPTDILSMNVLKDASSASIYGLRAANGVVMITTKRGESGNPRISVDVYAGVKTSMNKVKMANATEFITYFNEDMSMQKQYGNINAFQLAETNLQPFNTNWYDKLLKTGFTNNNNVSISGGSKTVDYFFSYNYYDEKGVLSNQSYNRSTIRNNNIYKFYDDRLRISQTLNISFSNNNPKPLDAFNLAYRQSPLVPVSYSNNRYGYPALDTTTGIIWSQDGDINNGKLNSIGNPIFTIDNYNERQKTLTLQAGVEGEFKITDFLKVSSRFGGTKYDFQTRVFTDNKAAWLYNQGVYSTVSQFEENKQNFPNSTTFANNSLQLQKSNTYRWTWEGFLTFSKTINKHAVEAVLGLSREKSNIGDFSDLIGYDVPTKSQYWSMNFASNQYEKQILQYQYTRLSLASYFARAQYNYDHKYYFSATVRRDGSSVFRTGENYWGTFPSFGIGWTLTEENFMKNINFLNYLKLRATWGKLGNQNIPFNQGTFNTSPTSSQYNYAFGNIYTTGATIGSPAKELSWEVTRESGIGFDFTVFQNRLSASFDYYDKLNTNAILPVTPIYTSQYENNYYDHVGKISNRGVEINLHWRDKLPIGLVYSVGVNYSHNKNKMKDVRSIYEGAVGGGLNDGQVTKRLANNQPIYAWWMFQADGVWQSQAEIDQAIVNGEAIYGTPRPGYLKYTDMNDDGVIDDKDKIYAGSYMPSYTYGIHLSLEYKNIDFNIDGYGVGGNKVFNYLKYARISSGENIAYDTFKNRWTGEGSTNKNPGANRESIASTYYLESGRYFRINNITLGYTFKDLVFKGSNLRAYITAQNPFVFTPYKGFTPEIVGGENGIPNGSAGIEMSAYPLNRSFLFGFNLQF